VQGVHRRREPVLPARAGGALVRRAGATSYGHIAPQPVSSGRIDCIRLIDWLDQPGGADEDCLVLNVWTPSFDTERRPVWSRCTAAGSHRIGQPRRVDGQPARLATWWW
jgi:para-nitrobenzyl esterase